MSPCFRYYSRIFVIQLSGTIIGFQADNRIRDISDAKRECQPRVKKGEAVAVLHSARRHEGTWYHEDTVPYIHTYIITTPDGSERSPSCPNLCPPRQKRSYWLGGWVCSRTSLKLMKKKNIICPHRTQIPRWSNLWPCRYRPTCNSG